LQGDPDGKSLDMDRSLSLAESHVGEGIDSSQEASIAQMAAQGHFEVQGKPLTTLGEMK